jgi:hypothetical protein
MPQVLVRPATVPRSAPSRARAEPLVFRAAMAVAALWVLDDAFWHREPGTAVSDHLASGLVPLALAALLAAVYPRLRAGARAAAALTSGALLVVVGVRGDEVTALLAGAAGIVLVLLGAGVLWGSRRGGRRRHLRRALIGVAALVFALFVVLPAGIAIVVNEKPRAEVERADLGRPYSEVTLTTSDGLRLAAWYAPSRNGAAVIAFPGRRGPVAHARLLARHGYGVLLLDRRGEGESEGDFNARGWGGEPDLRAAIAFLRSRADVRDAAIGGLGLSVGGELMLQTAAHDAGLRAVVSEGAGIRSVAEQKHMPGTPGEPLRWVATITTETAVGTVLSDHLPPPDLADLMPRIAPRPVLLIRGLEGNGDESLNRVYRDAGGPTTTLWEIPRAGHTAGLSAAPAEYERRVVSFFDAALLPAR